MSADEVPYGADERWAMNVRNGWKAAIRTPAQPPLWLALTNKPLHVIHTLLRIGQEWLSVALHPLWRVVLDGKSIAVRLVLKRG